MLGKTKSLPLSLLLKTVTATFVLLVIAVGISGYYSIVQNKKTFVRTDREYVQAMAASIARNNSVLMQQLRAYTMLDDIGRETSNVERIQEMLIAKAPYKFKDFISVAYVSYKNSTMYKDDGTTEYVEDASWFRAVNCCKD